MFSQKNSPPLCRLLITMSLVAILGTGSYGCSSGGDKDDDSADTDTSLDTAPHPELPPDTATSLSPTHKPTLVGIVIDSPVANLRLSGENRTANTDNDGRFDFALGESLVFNVGDTIFAPVTGASIITAFDLAATSDVNDTVLINTARFLQSLDIDGDVSNGISISDQAHTAAAGISLDFADADFDTQANAIVANSGSINTELIDGATAINNLQLAVSELPPGITIAGNWTRGTGNSLEALFLLEDGRWYHLMASCALVAGAASYEYGTYEYSETTGVVTFSVTNNPDACGFNAGDQLVTPLPFVHPTTTLTIGGGSWNALLQQANSARGAYIVDRYAERGGPLSIWALLAGGEFMSFGFAGQSDAATIDEEYCIQSGTYSVTGDEEVEYVVNVDSCNVGVDSDYYIDADFSDSTGPLELWIYSLTNDDDEIDYVALEPSRIGGSLTGGWDTDKNNLVVFTANGTITNGSERGVFHWNSQNGDALIDITRDYNLWQEEGGELAALNLGINSQITRLEPTGNLLRVTNADGSISTWNRYRKTVDGASLDGVWSRQAAAGVRTLTFYPNDVVGDYEVHFLDDDCPASAGRYERGEISGYDGSSASFALEIDNGGCGVVAASNIAIAHNGDTLVTDWGTFYRVR